MDRKSRRLVAEILQSIERGLQGDEATSDDTESVQSKKGRALESYMASVQDDTENEPPGK
jgi:hypothetical protein